MSLPPAIPTQARFNWIDTLIVPITGSIMETQPIVVGLAVLPSVFAPGENDSALPQLNSFLITLLLLGLHWWAIFVHFRVKGSQQSTTAHKLNLLGFVAALVLAPGIVLLVNADPWLLVCSVLLAIWSWWRGILWTRREHNDEQLILTFKVGFVALVLFLLLSMLRVNDLQIDQPLQTEAQALPLFFLSGLISLSFTRLSMMRQENERDGGSVSRLDASRTWLTLLSALWLVLVAFSISLEIFSFRFIQRIFQPVLNALFFGVLWIMTIIDLILQFLLSPLNGLFQPHSQLPTMPQSTPGHTQPQSPPHAPESIPPLLLLIGRVALLVAVLLILALVAWAILRVKRVRSTEDNGEREVRESLAMSTLFKGRQRRTHPKAATLETLDPQSARVYYRELLQTVAANRSNLSRQPGETPVEYQKRLQVALPPSPTDAQEAPDEATILDKLTRAYARERYGAYKLDPADQNFLRTWMPRLLRRFTDNSK